MSLRALGDDLREALRRIRRNPCTSLLAVSTLMLGIGAATAVFTLAHTILLAPPPYRESTRIVEVYGLHSHADRIGVSPADLADFNRDGLFESAALTEYAEFSWTGQSLPGFDGSEVLRGLLVTPGYFRVLDQSLAVGRGFASDEDRPGHNRVVVLSWSLWQRRFGGLPEVVGQTLTINGTVATVIGVANRAFLPYEDYEVAVWMPLVTTTWNRGHRARTCFARLSAGITLEQANRRLETIGARLAAAYPATNQNYTPAVEPLLESLRRSARAPITALVAAVLCLLAIAALNVASLMLARATSQSREMAIRVALGAGRIRLYRMVLAETVLLGLAASLGGALAGAWLLIGLKALIPPSLQVGWMFTADGRVFIAAFLLASVAGLTAGMAPAFESFRLAAGGLRPALCRHRLLRGIVTVEIAAAVVLSIAAGLLAKGFVNLASRPLGYRTDHILGLRVRLEGQRYRGTDANAAYWYQLIERTRSIPGVAMSASVSDLPMGQQYSGGPFEVEGLVVPPGQPKPHAHQLVASPGYFAAIGIPLLAGRAFTEADGPHSEPVAIVNDLVVQTYWPGQNPIGKRVRGWQSNDPWRRVVGVVRRIRHEGPEDNPENQIYVPYRQINWSTMFLVLRTHVPPDSVALDVRAAMQSIDPDVPAFEIRSMKDRLERELAMERIAPLLMTVFSAMAALLAVLGLFGVIGYWVSQRGKELGIRSAVGAQRGELRWLVVRQGGALALIGLLAGLAVSLPLMRLMRGTVYGVNEHDWSVYTAAVALTAAGALLACWAPAERAARIEPAAALREE